jgi:hypothetical protein
MVTQQRAPPKLARKVPQRLRIIRRAFLFCCVPLYRSGARCRIAAAFRIGSDSLFSGSMPNEHDYIGSIASA